MSGFERIYYQLNISLISPLSVGSGECESTDHDVFTDCSGNPVIPATGITGVLRAYIGGETADSLFGEIRNGDVVETTASKIRVYDALCIKGGKNISQTETS